jgi:hypothetical protein
LEIIASFTFAGINTSPSSLCMNGAGDTLFFLNQGIFHLPVDAAALPGNPFIAEDEHLFYSLAVDPQTSIIYTSDAIDYQQRGLILRYQPDGSLIDSFRAGIIPGKVVFEW